MKKCLAGTISVVALGLALAGCSVSPASNGTNDGTAGNAGNTSSKGQRWRHGHVQRDGELHRGRSAARQLHRL